MKAQKEERIAKMIKEEKVEENDGGKMTTQQFTQQTDSQLTGVQNISGRVSSSYRAL
jgi:hypothetical protein